MNRRFVPFVAACGLLVLATGCMPKMTIEQMRKQRAKRPAELDMLNKFVGHWEGTGTGRMPMLEEEELTSHGTEDVKWEGDGWYLVQYANYTMGGLGDLKGTMIWYWDFVDKKIKNIWVDTMGTMSVGSVKYNEKTGVWHMKSKSRGPWGRSAAAGTMKFTDDDTMEWTWTEWDGLKLMKFMEMSGLSHRKAAP